MVTSAYLQGKLIDATAALLQALRQGGDQWDQIGTAAGILTTLQSERTDDSVNGKGNVIAREGDSGGGG
jgi:hypothetical protein